MKRWVILAVVLAMGGLWTVIKDLPGTVQLNALQHGFQLIVDADGELAVRDYVHTIPISLAALPQHLPQAVLAIEDHRFYRHPGIDPISLGGALWDGLSEDAPLRGASTLTQQLARNLFLNSERTLHRKLRETLLGFWLEWRYTKDEILETYLNRVYFGNRAYGIEAAARTYFKKRATEVNLYEAALLAAALKAPNRINLFADPKATHVRARLVLEQMVKHGYIDRKQLIQSQRTGIEKGNREFRNIDYQYFWHWIAPIVKERLGRHRGRVRVITTLSSELQLYGELAVRRMLGRFSRHRVSEAALVAMSPNGAVKVMVGGIHYGVGPGKSTFNRAVQAKRQSGSTLKPVVYLQALQAGYTLADKILDAPLKSGTQPWPRNYDGRYHGSVPLEEALTKSLNAATVRLAKALGPAEIIALASKLGVTSPLTEDPGLALGIDEVSLLEVVTVFSVFANGGEKTVPFGLIGILDQNGKALYWRKPSESKQLVPPRQIASLNRMLQSAVFAGTGRQAAFGDHPAAGKTGTTQNHRDAWFVGYTAHWVAGVWVGNDNETPMDAISGGELPAIIWRNFMANAHLGLPVKPLGRR